MLIPQSLIRVLDNLLVVHSVRGFVLLLLSLHDFSASLGL